MEPLDPRTTARVLAYAQDFGDALRQPVDQPPTRRISRVSNATDIAFA